MVSSGLLEGFGVGVALMVAIPAVIALLSLFRAPEFGEDAAAVRSSVGPKG